MLVGLAGPDTIREVKESIRHGGEQRSIKDRIHRKKKEADNTQEHTNADTHTTLSMSVSIIAIYCFTIIIQR